MGDDRVRGYIIRTCGNRRFGFIRISNKEYFFHADDLLNVDWDYVEENTIKLEVECQIMDSPKGLRVGYVQVLGVGNE